MATFTDYSPVCPTVKVVSSEPINNSYAVHKQTLLTVSSQGIDTQYDLHHQKFLNIDLIPTTYIPPVSGVGQFDFNQKQQSGMLIVAGF